MGHSGSLIPTRMPYRSGPGQHARLPTGRDESNGPSYRAESTDRPAWAPRTNPRDSRFQPEPFCAEVSTDRRRGSKGHRDVLSPGSQPEQKPRPRFLVGPSLPLERQAGTITTGQVAVPATREETLPSTRRPRSIRLRDPSTTTSACSVRAASTMAADGSPYQTTEVAITPRAAARVTTSRATRSRRRDSASGSPRCHQRGSPAGGTTLMTCSTARCLAARSMASSAARADDDPTSAASSTWGMGWAMRVGIGKVSMPRWSAAGTHPRTGRPARSRRPSGPCRVDLMLGSTP